MKLLRACVACNGAGEVYGGDVCRTCRGFGLQEPFPEACSACEGGHIGRFTCPVCGGEGVSYGEFQATSMQERAIDSEELQEAYRSEDPFYDPLHLGVLCGLHAEARARYPDEPDYRAWWLNTILSSGQIIVSIDGIWHVKEGIGVRIKAFGEFE